MKIVVVGGSGLIGSKLCAILVARGHDPMPADLRTGVNTITREGLDEALRGAEAVVDVTNAPSWEDTAVMDFFTTSTRNLLAAEATAGVEHHVTLSIVGVDEFGMGTGYGRAKVAQEELVVASGTPHCILRATQFFELLPQIAEFGADGDVVRLSAAKLQPIAADDVAATLADLATSTTRGGVEVAGPDVAGIDEWGRRLFAATGDEREVITDPTFNYFGAPIPERALIPHGEARTGRITFDEWAAAREPVR
jgi:uncharacterized protein YbjT (DUF2867 family)